MKGQAAELGLLEATACLPQYPCPCSAWPAAAAALSCPGGDCFPGTPFLQGPIGEHPSLPLQYVGILGRAEPRMPQLGSGAPPVLWPQAQPDGGAFLGASCLP